MRGVSVWILPAVHVTLNLDAEKVHDFAAVAVEGAPGESTLLVQLPRSIPAVANPLQRQALVARISVPTNQVYFFSTFMGCSCSCFPYYYGK